METSYLNFKEENGEIILTEGVDMAHSTTVYFEVELYYQPNSNEDGEGYTLYYKADGKYDDQGIGEYEHHGSVGYDSQWGWEIINIECLYAINDENPEVKIKDKELIKQIESTYEKEGIDLQELALEKFEDE